MGEAAQLSEQRPRKRLPPESAWRDYATAALPVLACFLGGATEKWAEGIVLALLGLLLIVCPPPNSLGVFFNSISAALVACAAVAYLPARWFFQPAWRTALVHDFNVKIAPTLSPQPWITAGCFLSLLAGLAWLYYVSAQDAEQRAVRRQIRTFAGGIVLLAALAIILHLAHCALPFWHNERGFGPFPNRNQTADLLGITAVLLLACGQDDFRQKKRRWLFWLCGLALLIAGLVLNFSRAGILILIAGSALWLGFFVLRSGTTARIATGASAMLILLTLLLIFGGKTLERFNLRGSTGSGMSSDFRWLIFQDTFALIRASPWCGIGLGNFEPVFAIFRDASLGQTRALHPESDWLWLTAELGWPGVFLIVLGAAVLLWQVFPLREGTNQRFRVAALIAALLFALHGFVDVSAHRVGTSFAGLFLLGLALKRPLAARKNAALPTLFRAAGVMLCAAGVTSIIASLRAMPLPGGIGLAVEKQLAARANSGRNFQETIAHATRGLGWAPLDWQLYFQRALGKGGANHNPAEALDDFRRARFLEPSSFEVPYQEGLAWITREPLLAMTAWREALHRAGRQRAELYGRMLSAASSLNPALNKSLQEWASRQSDLAFAYLALAFGEDFMRALERLLQRDETLATLSASDKNQLFGLWVERGDVDRLTASVERHPEWLPYAWRGVAKQRAARGDFRSAVELTRRFEAKPALPRSTSGASTEQLQKSLYATPNNFAVGFELSERQMREGKVDDALLTLRRFTGQTGAPAYFHFLEAEAWSARENWERAWQARQQFEVTKSSHP